MDETKVKEVFAKKLKELQNQSGNITQNQFAEKIGVSSNTLSMYYKGAKNPTLTTLVKIAEACDVSVDWLCGMSEKQSYNTMTTYADVFCAILDIIDALEKDGCKCSVYGRTYIGDHWCCPALDIDNSKIIDDLFETWEEIKALYDKKTINQELYNAWIEQKKRELDKPIEIPMPDPDDLPF